MLAVFNTADVDDSKVPSLHCTESCCHTGRTAIVAPCYRLARGAHAVFCFVLANVARSSRSICVAGVMPDVRQREFHAQCTRLLARTLQALDYKEFLTFLCVGFALDIIPKVQSRATRRRQQGWPFSRDPNYERGLRSFARCLLQRNLHSRVSSCVRQDEKIKEFIVGFELLMEAFYIFDLVRALEG